MKKIRIKPIVPVSNNELCDLCSNRLTMEVTTSEDFYKGEQRFLPNIGCTSDDIYNKLGKLEDVLKAYDITSYSELKRDLDLAKAVKILKGE